MSKKLLLLFHQNSIYFGFKNRDFKMLTNRVDGKQIPLRLGNCL